MAQAPFAAFFDETGHSSEAEFVGLAGFVAAQVDWQRFASAWTEVLHVADVAQFHAREFAHSTGMFQDWKGDESRRRAFVELLVDVIREAKPTPVGAIADARAFRKMPDLVRSRIKDAYCHCFQTVVRGAAITVMSEPPDATVDVTVADMPERRGDVEEMWNLLRTTIDHRSRLGNLERTTPSLEPKLQAADFLAYEMNLEFERITGRTTRSQRWPIKQFLEIAGPHPLIQYFDSTRLLEIYGFRA